MRITKKRFVLGAAVSTAMAAAVGIPAVASSSGDDDAGEREAPITGTYLEQASEAALDHVGEGKVTETEVGDEQSYYEVEVKLEDGRQVEVQLDKGFNVVGSGDDVDRNGDTDD